MSIKKVLIIADNPTWIVNRCVQHMVRMMSSNYIFTTMYDQSMTKDEFDAAAKVADIIHFNSWEKLHEFINVCIPYMSKTVLTVRSHRYNKDSVGAFGSRCRAIVGVSQAIANEMVPFNGTVYYIPDGIEPRILYRGYEPVIGFAGHIGDPDDYKGYKLIKQACIDLGFRLMEATGQIDSSNMPNFYESIDAYVCASIAEGFSTPCMEAMAMNLPVITTNCGIPGTLNVITVDRSVEGIKNGLLRIFPRQQVKDFTWENVCLKYDELYSTI